MSGTLPRSASVPWIERATSVDPVKTTALRARVGDERRANDGASPWNELENVARNSSLMKQPDCLCRDQRRLFRRFRENRVSRGDSRHDLPCEDGEGEVPRADADSWAKRRMWCGKLISSLSRVITAIIDSFAHFRDGVRHRLARLADEKGAQPLHGLLKEIAAAFQDGGPLACIRPSPALRGGSGRRHGRFDIRRSCRGRVADDFRMIGGILDCLVSLSCGGGRGEDGLGIIRSTRAIRDGALKFARAAHVRQIEPLRVLPLRPEQVSRKGDQRMRRAAEPRRLGDRIGDQFLDRDFVVDELMDERGIGPVLQQPPDEIGEERLMRPHWRVNAARPVEVLFTDHVAVKRLAHAVQALELVIADLELRPRHVIDRRERVGVVRRELGEDDIAAGEQALGASEIADVGIGFLRVNRIAAQAIDLGALDFAVPVRALDEAHHKTAFRPFGEINEVIDHERRALLIGLHDEAEPLPAAERAVVCERFEKIE